MPPSLKRFPSRSINRALLVGGCCIPVFAVIHFAAYWLRFDGYLSPNRWVQLVSTLAAVLVIKSAVFWSYRVYHSWSRYLTFYDLVKLAQAATLSAVLLALFDYLVLATKATPRSVFFMDWGATIVVLGGLRAFRRWLQEGRRLLQHGQGKPVLIVGADDYGETLLRTMRRNENIDYHAVGFVAENPASVGSCIGGVPVVGTIDQTCELARRLGVDEIVIAGSGFPGKVVRKLVNAARQIDIAVKVLPSYEQLLGGKVGLRPREVSIADLLRRDPVDLDMRQLHGWLDGQTLLVTGAAGSIGSEICRQLLQFQPAKVVVVDRSENGQFFLERELRRLARPGQLEICIADVADKSRMSDVFRRYCPTIVFHAAAYKHVPLMELNCGEAIKNIPLATRNLADLAEAHGVQSFVMISTDKAVNPTSVMGACKRVAEIYVQALATRSKCRFVTVRFGNVLGSAGSVVPVFADQIASGGPVTVTHPDMQRYFMMIPEASQLVIQAGAMGKGGEIFVLDMGEPVKIVDLAKDMIRLSGLRMGTDIEIQFTGIRPGEKLFEELLIDGETHLPTSHPKIMVAACQRMPVADIEASLNRLKLAAGWDDQTIVGEIKQIVPEFEPTRFGSPAPNRKAA